MRKTKVVREFDRSSLPKEEKIEIHLPEVNGMFSVDHDTTYLGYFSDPPSPKETLETETIGIANFLKRPPKALKDVSFDEFRWTRRSAVPLSFDSSPEEIIRGFTSLKFKNERNNLDKTYELQVRLRPDSKKRKKEYWIPLLSYDVFNSFKIEDEENEGRKRKKNVKSDVGVRKNFYGTTITEREARSRMREVFLFDNRPFENSKWISYIVKTLRSESEEKNETLLNFVNSFLTFAFDWSFAKEITKTINDALKNGGAGFSADSSNVMNLVFSGFEIPYEVKKRFAEKTLNAKKPILSDADFYAAVSENSGRIEGSVFGDLVFACDSIFEALEAYSESEKVINYAASWKSNVLRNALFFLWGLPHAIKEFWSTFEDVAFPRMLYDFGKLSVEKKEKSIERVSAEFRAKIFGVYEFEPTSGYDWHVAIGGREGASLFYPPFVCSPEFGRFSVTTEHPRTFDASDVFEAASVNETERGEFIGKYGRTISDLVWCIGSRSSLDLEKDFVSRGTLDLKRGNRGGRYSLWFVSDLPLSVETKDDAVAYCFSKRLLMVVDFVIETTKNVVILPESRIVKTIKLKKGEFVERVHESGKPCFFTTVPKGGDIEEETRVEISLNEDNGKFGAGDYVITVNEGSKRINEKIKEAVAKFATASNPDLEILTFPSVEISYEGPVFEALKTLQKERSKALDEARSDETFGGPEYPTEPSDEASNPMATVIPFLEALSFGGRFDLSDRTKFEIFRSYVLALVSKYASESTSDYVHALLFERNVMTRLNEYKKEKKIEKESSTSDAIFDEETIKEFLKNSSPRLFASFLGRTAFYPKRDEPMNFLILHGREVEEAISKRIKKDFFRWIPSLLKGFESPGGNLIPYANRSKTEARKKREPMTGIEVYRFARFDELPELNVASEKLVKRLEALNLNAYFSLNEKNRTLPDGYKTAFDALYYLKRRASKLISDVTKKRLASYERRREISYETFDAVSNVLVPESGIEREAKNYAERLATWRSLFDACLMDSAEPDYYYDERKNASLPSISKKISGKRERNSSDSEKEDKDENENENDNDGTILGGGFVKKKGVSEFDVRMLSFVRMQSARLWKEEPKKDSEEELDQLTELESVMKMILFVFKKCVESINGTHFDESDSYSSALGVVYHVFEIVRDISKSTFETMKEYADQDIDNDEIAFAVLGYSCVSRVLFRASKIVRKTLLDSPFENPEFEANVKIVGLAKTILETESMMEETKRFVNECWELFTFYLKRSLRYNHEAIFDHLENLSIGWNNEENTKNTITRLFSMRTTMLDDDTDELVLRFDEDYKNSDDAIFPAIDRFDGKEGLRRALFLLKGRRRPISSVSLNSLVDRWFSEKKTWHAESILESLRYAVYVSAKKQFGDDFPTYDFFSKSATPIGSKRTLKSEKKEREEYDSDTLAEEFVKSYPISESQGDEMDDETVSKNLIAFLRNKGISDFSETEELLDSIRILYNARRDERRLLERNEGPDAIYVEPRKEEKESKEEEEEEEEDENEEKESPTPTLTPPESPRARGRNSRNASPLSSSSKLSFVLADAERKLSKEKSKESEGGSVSELAKRVKVIRELEDEIIELKKKIETTKRKESRERRNAEFNPRSLGEDDPKLSALKFVSKGDPKLLPFFKVLETGEDLIDVKSAPLSTFDFEREEPLDKETPFLQDNGATVALKRLMNSEFLNERSFESQVIAIEKAKNFGIKADLAFSACARYFDSMVKPMLFDGAVDLFFSSKGDAYAKALYESDDKVWDGASLKEKTMFKISKFASWASSAIAPLVRSHHLAFFLNCVQSRLVAYSNHARETTKFDFPKLVVETEEFARYAFVSFKGACFDHHKIEGQEDLPYAGRYGLLDSAVSWIMESVPQTPSETAKSFIKLHEKTKEIKNWIYYDVKSGSSSNRNSVTKAIVPFVWLYESLSFNWDMLTTFETSADASFGLASVPAKPLFKENNYVELNGIPDGPSVPNVFKKEDLSKLTSKGQTSYASAMKSFLNPKVAPNRNPSARPPKRESEERKRNRLEEEEKKRSAEAMEKAVKALKSSLGSMFLNFRIKMGDSLNAVGVDENSNFKNKDEFLTVLDWRAPPFSKSSDKIAFFTDKQFTLFFALQLSRKTLASFAFMEPDVSGTNHTKRMHAFYTRSVFEKTIAEDLDPYNVKFKTRMTNEKETKKSFLFFESMRSPNRSLANDEIQTSVWNAMCFAAYPSLKIVTKGASISDKFEFYPYREKRTTLRKGRTEIAKNETDGERERKDLETTLWLMVKIANELHPGWMFEAAFSLLPDFRVEEIVRTKVLCKDASTGEIYDPSNNALGSAKWKIRSRTFDESERYGVPSFGTERNDDLRNLSRSILSDERCDRLPLLYLLYESKERKKGLETASENAISETLGYANFADSREDVRLDDFVDSKDLYDPVFSGKTNSLYGRYVEKRADLTLWTDDGSKRKTESWTFVEFCERFCGPENLEFRREILKKGGDADAIECKRTFETLLRSAPRYLLLFYLDFYDYSIPYPPETKDKLNFDLNRASERFPLTTRDGTTYRVKVFSEKNPARWFLNALIKELGTENFSCESFADDESIVFTVIDSSSFLYEASPWKRYVASATYKDMRDLPYAKDFIEMLSDDAKERTEPMDYIVEEFENWKSTTNAIRSSKAVLGGKTLPRDVKKKTTERRYDGVYLGTRKNDVDYRKKPVPFDALKNVSRFVSAFFSNVEEEEKELENLWDLCSIQEDADVYVDLTSQSP